MDDVTRMWNPFAKMAHLAGNELVIVRGERSTVFDESGKPYLDAIGSLWYCNVGYGRNEIAEAAADQMRRLAAFQTFEYYSNPPAETLARRVAELSPIANAKVFFTSGGGSDAIDTAGKLARAYWVAVGRPDKRVMISRSLSYHGMNAYGTSLGGIPANMQPFQPLVTMVEHVPWDDVEALAEAIERLGPENVAAFFAEPVIGAGGVYFPPEGYLAKAEALCRDNDVLLVCDEVISGFGRTGEWFAAERYSIEPDLITVAKGLTSGYAPLGALIAGERVAEPFWAEGSNEMFRHGYTYSGHPTSCAVALANLDIIEREGLVGRVRELESVAAAALKPLADHPLVSEVRTGQGLLAAVEVAEERREADPALVARLVREVRNAGAITRGLRGAALQFSPPFVITEQEIEQVAGAFAAGLDAVSS